MSDLQTRLQDAQAQLAEIGQRQRAIEAEIAARWNEDTSVLEAEYGGLMARANALPMVIAEIEKQIHSVEIEAAKETLRAGVLAWVEALRESRKAGLAAEKARHAYEQKREAATVAAQARENAALHVRQCKGALERLGLSSDETADLESAFTGTIEPEPDALTQRRAKLAYTGERP